MQRVIMDMPLMISAAIRHAADHVGKTEVVALAIEALRWFLFALVLVGLAACESTANIDKGLDASTQLDGGLVIFTVTHDKDTEHFGRSGGNVKLFVTLRDTVKGAELPRVFSNMETLSPVMTSPFDNVWGRYYVRQLPVGRYEFSGWTLEQNTGVGINTITPRKAPPPLTFEVAAGSVSYLGSIHGELVWGKNLFGIPLASGAVPQVRNEAERDLPLIWKEYPQLRGKVEIRLLPEGRWLID